MKESFLKYLYAFILFICFTAISFAQPDDDDIDPHPADEDPLPASFDSNVLIVLLIIGVAFAFYIINKRKEKLHIK